MVVVVAPCRDQMAGMAQAGEEMLIEALVAEPADKVSTKPFCMGLPGAI
jgi:hypothetical protein